MVKGIGMLIKDGWFRDGGKVIWGLIHHNGWWGGLRADTLDWVRSYRTRAALTRRMPGRTGPGLTEDLAGLSDAMRRSGFTGFEHNYGLWYDRRRDHHDEVRRTSPAAVPPFLEQPWARGNTGTAWDGLPRYDLTAFNPWYFGRLKEFAAICDRQGLVLFHNFYMQHALLEMQAHYADFPWRPVNCLQRTGMPDRIPAANAFYDISDPVRRDLHERYIRTCLNELGAFHNVVHLLSEEYTGPAEFVLFWMDVTARWCAEKGRRIHLGLGATKDVLDAVLADPSRAAQVAVLDLRYWWYREDGELFAPAGGQETAGRYISGPKDMTPPQLYRQVREYRNKYPGKAILHTFTGRRSAWAFLCGGGAMLIHQMKYPEGRPPADPWDPPVTYETVPPDADEYLPTCSFVAKHLATRLPGMQPMDDAVTSADGDLWGLESPDGGCLIYSVSGRGFRCRTRTAWAGYVPQWFDPRTGWSFPAGSSFTTAGPDMVEVAKPDTRDWVLYWFAESGRTENEPSYGP